MGELFEIFGHNRGNPIKPLLDEHTVINSRPQGEKINFGRKSLRISGPTVCAMVPFRKIP